MIRCMGCMEKYDEQELKCPHCGFVEGTIPEQANQMLPGSILHDKFIVGKVIGYGGFGITYIGYDAELDRKVAIKEYMPNEFSGRVQGETKVTVYDGDRAEQFSTGLEKFVGEAKRLAQFQNIPGIVQIYDSFMDNNTAYIVMEYLEGETLKEKLKRDGKMTLQQSLEVILPIASALKEVHKTGIIHRDLAPDNIMVTTSGEAKLIDFGASRFATATHSRSLTVLIKQGYAPVEQYNSRGEQGSWTDVYALAATFYKMLTGITPEDSMERKVHDNVKTPSKVGAKVSKNIDTAIMNAMNLSIEYRTKTMEEFEQEILSDGEVARVIEPEHKADVGKMPLWSKFTIGGVAAALVLFVVLIFTGVIPLGTAVTEEFVMEEGMTYVPGFVNQSSQKAEALATQNRVVIQLVNSVYSNDIEQNMVCGQDINSGSEVELYHVVNLTVSAGRQLLDMPECVGVAREEAVAILSSMGLQVIVEEVYDNRVEGYIIAQSIEALSQIEPGSEIVLTVSKGPDPNEVIDETVEIEMPELVGLTSEEAQEKLAALKLRIQPVKEYSNTVEKGRVMAQQQKPGTVLHEGDTVVFTVSDGKQMVNVPYVIAKAEAEAKALLEEKSLKTEITREYNASVKAGNVISQSVAANTTVEAGTTVKLVISLGTENKEITVPDVQNLTVEEAESRLRQQGLYSSITYTFHDTVALGQVISQDPVGTTVPTGTTVNLVVSNGKETKFVTVPNVVGQTEGDARSSLTGSGLNVSVASDYSDTVAAGIVISQSESGTKVLPQTTINLMVSQGKNPAKEWSGWVDSLPAEVTSSAYDIETKNLYRYRELQTTTSQTPLTGWGSPVKTETNYSAWVESNDWVDDQRSNTELSELVESKTVYQYRTRSKETKENVTSVPSGDGWQEDSSKRHTDRDTSKDVTGAWSDWSRTAISPSSDASGETKVETRTGTESIEKETIWLYYHYVNTNPNKAEGVFRYTYSWNYTQSTDVGFWVYEHQEYLSDHGDEYDDWNGDSYGNSYVPWYRQNPEKEVIHEDKEYTEYRSQRITYGFTTYYTYWRWTAWSGWSGWSTTNPGAKSDTLDVNSKTQYRYKTRTIKGYTYTYQKWGEYGGWSDQSAAASATREVQTKQQYRYKLK